MGVLKDLYQKIWDEIGGNQASQNMSEGSFTEKLRRDTVRVRITKELNNLERMMLLNSKQMGALSLYHEGDDDLPFDELELIVKNNVLSKNHIKNVKECILDLDEISTVEDATETTELHDDDLSKAVLKMLHCQTAQVLLLSDSNTNSSDNGQAEWFVKQPEAFVQATLIANDRKQDAFSEIHFEEDLSSIDLDCHEYLRKPHVSDKWSAIRNEDESFNKDAQKLLKDIHELDVRLGFVSGKEREEIENKKLRAENVLLKATYARGSAIQDAFREGVISEYYYKTRNEQLIKRDYKRVPEMFEEDDIKNREQYLKDHDLQDLSKDEADAICNLALKKAQKDKNIYLTKQFLTKKGLANSSRYLLSEMALNREIFYRGLATGKKQYDEDGIENSDKVSRISVDIDEIGEDYIGMTMRQVQPVQDELYIRSLKK